MTSASRSHVMTIIQSFSGKDNVIGIPLLYVQLTGDYAAAALLNQMLYWSERTSDPDGWFYKSYREWQEELCLSQYQVKRIIEGDKRSKKTKSLKNLGVETTLKKSKKGAPTIHYRIDEDILIEAIYKHLEKTEKVIINNVDNPIVNNVDNEPSTMSTMDTEQCQQSLRTETTTETTAKTTPQPPADKPSVEEPVPTDTVVVVVEKTEEQKPLHEQDNDLGMVVRAYEKYFGAITLWVKSELEDALRIYGAKWICEALEISAKNNKRFWKYALGILKRWKAEGQSDSEKVEAQTESAKEMDESVQKTLDAARLMYANILGVA